VVFATGLPPVPAAAPGAGVSQQAPHPPSGRCTCASGVHLRFQGRSPGVSWCTCGIQACLCGS
jgi:hypothetical protein